MVKKKRQKTRKHHVSIIMCRLGLIINFIIHIFFSTIFDNPLHSLPDGMFDKMDTETKV